MYSSLIPEPIVFVTGDLKIYLNDDKKFEDLKLFYGKDYKGLTANSLMSLKEQGIDEKVIREVTELLTNDNSNLIKNIKRFTNKINHINIDGGI
jgi:hypothetical protein